ncbi:MAG: methylmalonyl-CoA mutase family protein [Chloroflexota bacterium]
MTDRDFDQSEQAAYPPPTFDEFDKPAYEIWYQTTVDTLKGGDFDKKLTSATYEGVTLQPLYFQWDAADIAHQHTLPGEFPYVRGIDAEGYLVTPWAIAQAIPYPTPAEFNTALRHDMARGQTAVTLPLDSASRNAQDPDTAGVGTVGVGGVSVASLADLTIALEGVDLNATPVIIEAGAGATAAAAMLAALARIQGVDHAVLRGSVGLDPLGTLAAAGELPTPVTQGYDEMAALTKWAAVNAPHLGTVIVDATPYHEGGANAVQELAYALATGVAYIRALQERGLGIDEIARHTRFVFAVGGQFFATIAKLRAARLLWAQVIEAFGGSKAEARLRIHARTGRYNKTVYDPYVNMLRTTSEALAGALGGVQSMHVDAFDAIIRPPDAFSRRIARNQQIILQEEVNLTKLVDPAGGSWYIEHLTDQFARLAWDEFQAIEARGGMLAALESGIPQRAVADVAEQRAANLKRRKDRLVGTNMYANLDEVIIKPDATDYAAIASARGTAIAGERPADLPQNLTTFDAIIDAVAHGATLGQVSRALREAAGPGPQIDAVALHRLADPFETLRRDADAYAARTGVRPRIFLANMGPLKQHKARADFTQGFFQVGGFDVVYPAGFDSPEAAALAALADGAPAVVICSTDDDYPGVVAPIVQTIRAQRPEVRVILAGYPKDQIDTHRAAGVDEFIYLGADCYLVNRWLQEQIGVAE